MTESTLTTLAASPETGLISIRFKHSFLSIRSLDAGCHVTCREASVVDPKNWTVC